MQDPKKQWLIPLLKTIEHRPASYLLGSNVAILSTYIRAYAKARTDLGFPPFGEGEATLLEDFEAWLKKKLGRLNGGWFTHVLNADPSGSMKTFYIFFNEFYADWSLGREEKPFEPWAP